MPGGPPTLHDLSKNADNHPAAACAFAAPQQAALQIQRKCRRLWRAILPPVRFIHPAFFYAATHGFLMQ
jgi:hypothetical protein